MNNTFRRIVVIGAGPAGLSAAIEAARAGAGVTVMEKQARPGAKLLAAGGGRCNFTQALDRETLTRRFGPRERFVRPALAETDVPALRAWLKARGVPSVAESNGWVYPVSNRSSDVLRALIEACRRGGVHLFFRRRARAILCDARGVTGVLVEGADGAEETEPADAVILAAGGLSRPAMGGCRDAWELAGALGHRLVAPSPALAPVVLSDAWVRACAGVSLPDARLTIQTEGGPGFSVRGPLLFTHRGLSGPCALDLSASIGVECQQRASLRLRLNLLAERSEAEWRDAVEDARARQGRRPIRVLLRETLPVTLVDALMARVGLAKSDPLAQLGRKQCNALLEQLTACPLEATAVGGMDEAMATRGGISREAVDSRTLESRLVHGLYIAGEAVDVDGPCGGFNLHWAFASGILSGRRAAGCVLREAGDRATFRSRP